MFNKNKTNKIRRQEINYSYVDANMIPKMNKYLMECDLDMKLIRLSWDIMNSRIRIVFKSNFEVRRIIADKLRELDVDIDGVAIKKKLFFQRLILQKRK